MAQKAFRLTESEIQTLESVAKACNCTQTEVIRQCIQALKDGRLSFIQEGIQDAPKSDTSDTPGDTVETDALRDEIAVLKAQVETQTSQLAAKDSQIAEGMAALAKAQQLTDQAQQLHAQDSKTLAALGDAINRPGLRGAAGRRLLFGQAGQVQGPEGGDEA